MGVSPKLERIPEESALLPLQLLQIVHFPSPLQALQKKKTFASHIRITSSPRSSSISIAFLGISPSPVQGAPCRSSTRSSTEGHRAGQGDFADLA